MTVPSSRVLRSLVALLLAASFVVSAASAADKPVKLLGAGSGPLTELRYTPELDRDELAEVTLALDSSVEIGGMQVPIQMPPVVMRVGARVIGLDETRIRYEYRVLDLRIDDGAARALEGELKGIVGTKATVALSPTGHIQSAEYSVPASAPPELLQNLRRSMSDSGTPLPVEPVGIGARWQVDERIESAGLPVDRTTTYTLRALDGRRATLDVAVTQSAEPRTLDDPNLPAGTVARLEKLSGSGGGTLVVDLDRLLPIRSAIDVQVDTRMSIAPPVGPAQPMSMRMKVSTRIVPIEP